MHNFKLLLFQEDRHHLISKGEPLLPIPIIQILLNVLLPKLPMLPNKKLIERILQKSTEDPLPQDAKVGH